MKKYGFSLIEVLMVMGIIGVVAAMGFSVSQKGIEKAYRQYWYTGYSSLQDATFDAIAHQKLTHSTYVAHVADLMNATVTDSGTDKIITAPNGIKYTVQAPLTLSGQAVYYIWMQIPAPKQKEQVKDKTPLIYNQTTGELYPGYVPQNPSPSTQQAYVESVDLQQRIDLLPYIVNDGLPSRASGHNSNIYNFHDAYCATHNNITLNPHPNQSYRYYAVKCDSTNPVATVNGLPVLVNPKKVF